MRTIIAAVAAVLAVAGAGCASNPADADDTSAAGNDFAQEQEAHLAFAQCMREHGIDFPDPEVSQEADGGILVRQRAPDDADTAAFQEAEQTCREEHLEGRVGPGNGPGMSAEERQEFQEEALAFARCMREHGFDMPDPQFDGEGLVRFGGPDQGSNQGPDFESEEFVEAEEACRGSDPVGGGGAMNPDQGDL